MSPVDLREKIQACPDTKLCFEIVYWQFSICELRDLKSEH